MNDAKDRTLARKRVHLLGKTGRLTELRESCGLSQSDVARYLGVSQPTVWRWERGQHTPMGPHAAALLDLLEAL